MCIIAIKPLGVDLFTEDELFNMSYNNYDGFGYAYASCCGRKVYIRKDFDNFDNFNTAIDHLRRDFDKDRYALMVHFRFATSGSNDYTNNHPFLTSHSKIKFGDLDVVNGKGDVALAHNGHIEELNYKKSKNSDTKHLAHLYSRDYKRFESLIGYSKKGISTHRRQRVAILYGNGEYRLYNPDLWIYDASGRIFSNDGYKVNMYDLYEDYKGFNYDYYTKDSYSNYSALIDHLYNQEKDDNYRGFNDTSKTDYLKRYRAYETIRKEGDKL